uniref:cyclin-A1-3-like n=1 Tax=Erigeron canadensis TaxID=72917 RepID=UPI001CB90B17|nr:cyclin-A1-3-like [Erigeron canadensis]
MGSIDHDKLFETMACEIYHHLRESEEDMTRRMRAVVIDWLVEVSEYYRLVPETLYLTINYIDRYLSCTPIDPRRLQLLGVTCMMIASKYEEIRAPKVDDFCYITDNTYSHDEVLQMESSVLDFLKFEMTAPTARCFLRLFLVPNAQMDIYNMGIRPMQLLYLASYISDLSLLRYRMLHYAPSLIAASAIFLARFLFMPSRKPWNLILRNYTPYQPSDLQECVKALHELVCKCPHFKLQTIREKYSRHSYKRVAKITCPASIPLENFKDITSRRNDRSKKSATMNK